MKTILSILILILSVNCNAKMKHKRNVFSEEQCLLSAIVYEAGGESVRGKKAVMQVVKNRAKIRQLTICKVISEHHQFSWYGKKPIKKLTKSFKQLLQELEQMDEVFDGVAIEYFHNTSVKPAWAKKLHYVGRVNKHKFYKRMELE